MSIKDLLEQMNQTPASPWRDVTQGFVDRITTLEGAVAQIHRRLDAQVAGVCGARDPASPRVCDRPPHRDDAPHRDAAHDGIPDQEPGEASIDYAMRLYRVCVGLKEEIAIREQCARDQIGVTKDIQARHDKACEAVRELKEENEWLRTDEATALAAQASDLANDLTSIQGECDEAWCKLIEARADLRECCQDLAEAGLRVESLENRIEQAVEMLDGGGSLRLIIRHLKRGRPECFPDAPMADGPEKTRRSRHFSDEAVEAGAFPKHNPPPKENS